MERPPWLQPCAILRHRPTDCLLEVNRLRRERHTGQYFVSETPAPEPPPPNEVWQGYALSDCEPATLDHFQQPRWVKRAGAMVYVTDRQGVEPKENADSGWLVLEPVYLAACALATAFSGTVIDQTSHHDHDRLQWRTTAVADDILPLHQQEILLWEPIEQD